MRNGSSAPDAVPSEEASAAEATQTVEGQGRSGRLRADGSTSQPVPIATQVATTHEATAIARHGPGVPAAAPTELALHPRGHDGWADQPTETSRPPDVVRHGPGVPATLPASHARLTAEHVWRSSDRGRRSRRRPRLSRLLGWVLTVVLLAVSGVLLYPRLHHTAFHVTSVVIAQRARSGCGVDLTGQINTNGSAGTLSYQWLVQPSQQPPQPLSQSVLPGQRAVYVTIAVEGIGQGAASQTVTLQVLGPDIRTASTVVAMTCG
jgi:hypothetical protein